MGEEWAAAVEVKEEAKMSDTTDWLKLVGSAIGSDNKAAATIRLVRRIKDAIYRAHAVGLQDSEDQWQKIFDLPSIDDKVQKTFSQQFLELQAFKDEWDEKDGNSPGYNLQKARNYGEQGAMYKKLYEAFRDASEAMAELRIAHVSGGAEYTRAQHLLFKAREMDEARQSPKKAKANKPVRPLGRTRLNNLTTDQLREEVLRRESLPGDRLSNISVEVISTATRPNGKREIVLHWRCDDIDPDQYSATYDDDCIVFKAGRSGGKGKFPGGI